MTNMAARTIMPAIIIIITVGRLAERVRTEFLHSKQFIDDKYGSENKYAGHHGKKTGQMHIDDCNLQTLFLDGKYGSENNYAGHHHHGKAVGWLLSECSRTIASAKLSFRRQIRQRE